MDDGVDIVRDLLDKQLVDSDGIKMGRADGIVLAVDGDQQPRIDRLELGFAVLARRLHPRAEQWFLALRDRWSPRKTARQLVPWKKVTEITDEHIKLDLKAINTPAFDWERWLRDHVVNRIPGSGGEQ